MCLYLVEERLLKMDTRNDRVFTPLYRPRSTKNPISYLKLNFIIRVVIVVDLSDEAIVESLLYQIR